MPYDTRRDRKKNCKLLAIIAHTENNTWATDFFKSLKKDAFGTYRKKEEVWAPGTDGGYDYMKDMTRGHNYSEQGALQKARRDGVLREEWVKKYKDLSRKQRKIYNKYKSKWSSKLKALQKDPAFDSIKIVGGKSNIIFGRDGELFLKRSLLKKIKPETLSQLGLEINLEEEKLVSKSQAKKTSPEMEQVSKLIDLADKRGDDWTVKFSKSILKRLRHGKTLSPKQQGVLDSKLRAYGLSTKGEGLSLEDKSKEEALDALLDASESKGNDWMVNFVRSIKSQLARGKTLSDKQLSVIRKGFYKSDMSEKADLFRTASVESQLIRLGYTNPSLRNHLRPVLDHLTGMRLATDRQERGDSHESPRLRCLVDVARTQRDDCPNYEEHPTYKKDRWENE